jgi:putative phosphoribosyl transferase
VVLVRPEDSRTKELAVVPLATHLEEPGALEEVATLAVDWFSRHL